MPYARPTLTALKNTALQDIQTAGIPGVPATLLPKSILGVLATCMAGFAYLHYQYIDWISKQSVPFTATQEYLESWSNLRGIYRIASSYATGSASFTGTIGTLLTSGTTIRTDTGTLYTITTSGTIAAGGTVTVPIIAVVAGLAGNAGTGINLTISPAITGITALGSCIVALTGGAETETDLALRSRMLIAYASAANGGSLSDYKNWALAVPSVTRAWIKGSGMGPGSVTVYFMTDGIGNGFPAGNNGVATLELRSAAATGAQLSVANYIYPLRPVTALVYAVAPIASPINFSIQTLMPSTTTIQAGVSAALTKMFLLKGSPLGNTIYPSDVNAAIEGVPGVISYTLLSPVVPIVSAVGYLPTVGTITYS